VEKYGNVRFNQIDYIDRSVKNKMGKFATMNNF